MGCKQSKHVPPGFSESENYDGLLPYPAGGDAIRETKSQEQENDLPSPRKIPSASPGTSPTKKQKQQRQQQHHPQETQTQTTSSTVNDDHSHEKDVASSPLIKGDTTIPEEEDDKPVLVESAKSNHSNKAKSSSSPVAKSTPKKASPESKSSSTKKSAQKENSSPKRVVQQKVPTTPISMAMESLLNKAEEPPAAAESTSSESKAVAAEPKQTAAPPEPEKGKKPRRFSRNKQKDKVDKNKAENAAPSDKEKSTEKTDRIYKVLVKAQQNSKNKEELSKLWAKVVELCGQEPCSAEFQNPTTKSTPLHIAIRLMDAVLEDDDGGYIKALVALLEANPMALTIPDSGGNIPLHYAIAPTTHFQQETMSHYSSFQEEDPFQQKGIQTMWKSRAKIVKLLLRIAPETSKRYLSRNDVVYESGDATGGCSPLYRVLQTIPDDFEARGVTVEYVAVVHHAQPHMVGVGNASDGDKTLGLLYRRFTRQFDISEKFFSGDNSRPEIVAHRQKYKTAAGNTWKCIETLLKPTEPHAGNWHIVHRAVQVETPPDLLRYIVETNPHDLTQKDQKGNLPLHYAAMSTPPTPRPGDKRHAASFPEFYVKYVVDELLYKFPEGATIPDSYGMYPLALAIESGKKWIGGGIKSLYEAHPDALYHTDTNNENLLTVFSIIESEGLIQEDSGSDSSSANSSVEEKRRQTKKKRNSSVIRDEHHDAIMLVQRRDVDVSEVVTSMWAHEEDAGVQMLGCVAIVRMAEETQSDNAETLRIALSAIAAVVNAMKAHPNEAIVQEKACHALKGMAGADGKREVSLVASGAVAAVVGAMQAHLGDAGVQEQGSAALANAVVYGGADRATVVASVSGVTAIVNAIAAHPEAVGVQKEGCRALKELTEFPNANLPELPRSHTAPFLETARKNFPRECGEYSEIVLSRLSH